MQGGETPQLYTVLKAKERKAGSKEMFGSDVTYVLPGLKSGTESNVSALPTGGNESIISVASGRKAKRRRDGDDSDEEDDAGSKKFKF